jgi:hypothetical protein
LQIGDGVDGLGGEASRLVEAATTATDLHRLRRTGNSMPVDTDRIFSGYDG